MPDAPRITATDLKKRIDAGEHFTLIDTRNPQAWAESSVKAAGALRIPLDDLDQNLDKIPKTKPIVTYCT